MRVTPEYTRAEIQAAIDDLAADGGGRLHLAAGTYDIDEALVWRAGVDIVGEGYGTHLRASAATNVIESRYDPESATGELSDATIRNLRIDGNREGIDAGRWPEEDFAGTHSTSGLWIPFAERVTVDGLWVEHCAGHGIHPDAVRDTTLSNNVVRDCLIGFHVATRVEYQYGPTRTVARDNHVRNCRLNGIDFGSHASGCVAIGNTIEGCARGGHGEEEWAGLRLRGSDNVAIGNTVADCERGVLLAPDRTPPGWTSGAGLGAAHNRIRSIDATGVALRETEDANVAGNAVVDAGTGVEALEAPGVTVADNHVSDCGVGIRSVESPGTRVGGNQFVAVGTGVVVRDADGVRIGDNGLRASDRAICLRSVEGALIQGNVIRGGADIVAAADVTQVIALGNHLSDGALRLEGEGHQRGYNVT